ncbi:DNA translocase FtsK-like [Mugil cephalus]|uniref:DNA translocase FtsK-like n=1 Tax=Mugil cephalus TaxID=48193 RepID=UPI001FB59708|nr:DNA translocase FtsK-like [Mugil cephalus]
MIVIILLSCFSMMASVTPRVLPLSRSQGGATQGDQPAEAANQDLETQTPASLLPGAEQPQQGVPQQLDPQTDTQLNPSRQQYTRFPKEGSPPVFPPQPSTNGAQLTLPQQPLVFPPYGYFPLFSSPYRDQLIYPYGFPSILQSALPQTPAYQTPNSPVLPAVNAAGAAAPSGHTPPLLQPQQPQNPQIVYMLQQPMNPALGALSSEELEMAAKMSQLGVYIPNLLPNLPVGAVQPQSQATGLTNPQQQGVAPTVGTSAAGIKQIRGPKCSGSHLNANHVPAGLEGAEQEVVTFQKPAQPKLQPTQRNLS